MVQRNFSGSLIQVMDQMPTVSVGIFYLGILGNEVLLFSRMRSLITEPLNKEKLLLWVSLKKNPNTSSIAFYTEPNSMVMT